MTKEEENAALEKAWDSIREWVKQNCCFSETKKFPFPHHVYHWTRFEVYPSGNCALLRGSWGNPGESRPMPMIYGHEELEFSYGDYAPGWYGKEEDWPALRNRHNAGYGWGPDYTDHIQSHWLLRELYDNWSFIKSCIEGAIAADSRLKEFEA